MAYTRIYIHLVFGTKKRMPIMDAVARTVFIRHIQENASSKDIFIDILNGYEDHIHLLIRLHPSQNIALVAKQIKGESAHWANGNNLFTKHFAWAKGYYAASADGENLSRIRNYIRSQAARHYEPVKKYLEEMVNEQD